jgi:alpha-tubulin suppressor-like RCC1 family protein
MILIYSLFSSAEKYFGGHFGKRNSGVKLSSGLYHSLALASDGSVYAWGYNGYGQLGNGSTITSTIPVQVSIPAGVSFQSIAAGYDHSLAVATDGSVYAWGNNSHGQLGDGSTTTRLTPVQATIPTGVIVQSIAAGYHHSLALATDGSVYTTWPSNNLIPTKIDLNLGVNLSDTDPPVLSVIPSDITVECNFVPTPAQVTATDNTDESVPVIFTETRIDGICVNQYALTRTWTAMDAAGNTASASQIRITILYKLNFNGKME